MTRACLLLLLAAVISPGSACELKGTQLKKLDDGVVLFYRIKRPPLVLAQHFSMLFRFCKNGTAIPARRFKLDAVMPAHNHGMNYRAAIATRDDGLIEASGLLFHMPGHWQLIVDFATEAAIQRVKLDIQI